MNTKKQNLYIKTDVFTMNLHERGEHKNRPSPSFGLRPPMWDLWWTVLCWDRFIYKYFGFPPQYYSITVPYLRTIIPSALWPWGWLTL